MKHIYILMCETWGGTNYTTEVVEAFSKQSSANAMEIACQMGYKTCDVRYWVEKVELSDE
jgi:hypothetical protein